MSLEGATGGHSPCLARTPFGSHSEWAGKPRHQFDEIGVPAGAGFLVKAANVSLDRGLGDPEHLGNLRHAAHFDNGEQNTQLRRGEFVGLRDRFRWRRRVQRCLVNKQCGDAA
jgi:hypothetical protein